MNPFTCQMDHLQIDPNLPPRDVMQDLCIVQIQHGIHAPYHVDYLASTRQHELDHTDHTTYIYIDIYLPWFNYMMNFGNG